MTERTTPDEPRVPVWSSTTPAAAPAPIPAPDVAASTPTAAPWAQLSRRGAAAPAPVVGRQLSPPGATDPASWPGQQTGAVPVVRAEPGPEVAAPPAPPKRRGARGGVGVLSIVMLLAAAVLVVPGASAVWLRTTLHGEDAWVGLLGPLHEDEGFAEAIGTGAAANVPSGSRRDVERATTDAVRSDDFREAWERELRQAHGQAMAVLAGDDTSSVVLDLDDVADEVAAEADCSSGCGIDGDLRVVLVRGEYAGQVRDTGRLVDRLALGLPLAVLLLGGLGLWTARNRLRGVAVLGVAVAVIAGLSVVVTLTVPGAFADALAPDDARGAVEAVTGAVASSLLVVVVAVGIAGLAMAGASLLVERAKRSHQPPPMAWPGA